MTDTDMLYMASLQKKLDEVEAENAELRARISELEGKHWNECGQIAHYDDELRNAKSLLRESLPVLKAAFFANYKDTNAANELYDKIKAVVGGAE